MDDLKKGLLVTIGHLSGVKKKIPCIDSELTGDISACYQAIKVIDEQINNRKGAKIMDIKELEPKDPNKKVISEEDHVEKEWYKEAYEMKMDGLIPFMQKVLNGYCHDYGTIVHAVSACAIAAARAANSEAGLTSFQAGFVMWDFIRQWNYTSNETGLKIIDYDNMLYPQYEDRFDKAIGKDTWEAIQKKALKNLEESPNAHPRVIAHWKSIVNGVVPFGYFIKDD